jgi:ORF6N domain
MNKIADDFTIQNEYDGSLNIQSMIFFFRGQQVMIDRDLEEQYQVETKALNQAVKRNIDRFPEEFRFQLKDNEKNELVTHCDRLNRLKHTSSNPYVYTEQGVSMLSAVLKSSIAIKISIQIIKAFVELRRSYTDNWNILHRLDHLENRQFSVENRFDKVLKAFKNKSTIPCQGIFFDGQVFDAFVFVTNLIRSADSSIILIDNYIDEQVLNLMSKKKQEVHVSILTFASNPHLDLAVKRFNEQFSGLDVRIFKRSHDRFLIIDEKEVYHFGASLKDLGKKWFAFSKLQIPPTTILDQIQ